MTATPRERRLLEAILERTRMTVADLTAALAVRESAPLRKLRTEALAFVTGATVALREWDEEREGAGVTPLRPPSRTDLAAVKGLTERVDAIFENAKEEKP